MGAAEGEAATVARFMAPGQSIDALTAKAAKEVGIDPILFRRLIKRGERSWKGWQGSPVGAQGPSQLMPGTAQGLADKYGIDPNDYYGNLLGGAYYLRDQLKAFGGDARKAVAAYNAGPGNVQKYGGIPPFAETQRYVQNIFAGGWKPGQTVQSGAPRVTVAPQPGQPTPRTPARPGQPPATVLPTFNATAALKAIAGGGSALEALSKMYTPAKRPTKLTTIPTPQGQPNVKVVASKGVTPGPETESIVKLAKEYLGVKYSWGGGGIHGATYGVQQGANTKGFDCSGFIQFLMYKTYGIDVGDYTGSQIGNGTKVGLDNLRPGDAIFFGSQANPHHVGMYIGNGKFIESPHTGATIRISNLKDRSDAFTARRYGPAAAT